MQTLFNRLLTITHDLLISLWILHLFNNEWIEYVFVQTPCKLDKTEREIPYLKAWSSKLERKPSSSQELVKEVACLPLLEKDFLLLSSSRFGPHGRILRNSGTFDSAWPSIIGSLFYESESVLEIRWYSNAVLSTVFQLHL